MVDSYVKIVKQNIHAAGQLVWNEEKGKNSEYNMDVPHTSLQNSDLLLFMPKTENIW